MEELEGRNEVKSVTPRRLSKSMENLSVQERIESLRQEPAADCHDRTEIVETKEPKAKLSESPPQSVFSTTALSTFKRPHPLWDRNTRMEYDQSNSASCSNGRLGQSLPAHQFQSLKDQGTMENTHTYAGPEETYGRAECSLCLEEFEDAGAKVPRNLQCGHTFCTGCLAQLLMKVEPCSFAGTPVKMYCPLCHAPTQIEGRDIERLPKNYGLLDVMASTLSSYSTSTGGFTHVSPTAQWQVQEGQPAAIYCPDHGDHLSSYCMKDNALVCSSCLLYGAHKQHKCLLVNEAAKMSREKLQRLNPEVLGQKKRLEEALVEVEEVVERVQESGGRLVDELDACFNNLVQLVEERRRRLKLEVMERTQVRVQALLEQARDLRECIENASVVYHSSENLLKSDNFTMLKGSSLALERIEGVFINPPPTSPRANDDLVCEFSEDLCDEIASHLEGYGNIRPIVGTVHQLYLQPYHDGIRVSWEGHNLADNQGISYHLQVASGEDDYTNIYRGGDSKFTWKAELEHGVPYRFRVQVRTTEGVGNWSEPQKTMKAAPSFHWHDTWRNVKIELSTDKLEASWSRGGVHNYWATFAGDKLFEGGQRYFEIEIIDLGKPRPSKKLAIGVIGCGQANVKGIPWHDGRYAVGQWRDIPAWSFHPISGIVNSNVLSLEGKPYTRIALQSGDRIGMLVDMEEGKVTFFCNGQDLGVAFDDVHAKALLPAVSIRDKIRVRLRFPPPPYSKRTSKLIHLRSNGKLCVS